jgi:hypothetical protein
MDPAQTKAFAEGRLRILNVICFALAASVGLYMAIAWLVLEVVGFEAPLASGVGYLPQLLSLLGFLPLILAPLVSGSLLKKISTADQETSPEQVGTAFQTATVVGFALRESGAVVGLVLSLLTGQLFWCLALGGASLLAMMMGWPRREHLLGLLGADR